MKCKNLLHPHIQSREGATRIYRYFVRVNTRKRQPNTKIGRGVSVTHRRMCATSSRAHVGECTRVRVCVYIHIYICVYVCVCVYLRTCVNTYIYKQRFNRRHCRGEHSIHTARQMRSSSFRGVRVKGCPNNIPFTKPPPTSTL